VWWRTFFLQASWSYAFKQNLGFAALYRRRAPGTRLGLATLAEPFNTNPVASAFVIPFLARRDPPEPAAALEEFRRDRGFLASAFAAAGDRLAWQLLRPLAGLAGAGVAWLSQQAWLGAAALVLAYDAPQLALRASLWRAGAAGAPPGPQVQRLSAWAERARRAGLALTGFLAVAVALRGPGWGPAAVVLGAGAVVLALGVLPGRPRAGSLLALALVAAAVLLNRGLPRVR